ncbi:MAG: alginate export family protein, partial [Xanthomonadales bacterium]|nr:alginate export family protein [Xanthomonadales bacterium]
MDRNTTLGFLIASLLALPAGADDLAEAISGGNAGLSLRYRLELVDDDNFSEDAEASTLRLRLNYKTAAYRGWTSMIEFDHLAEVGLDDFNSGAGTSPGRSQFPVVADPDGSDLNQLWLQYAFSDDTSLRFGRQRILLDNQRYVGGVGWRQNEQTYDSAKLDFKLGSGSGSYTYVANVNRIFGNDVPAGDHDHNTHLLNGSWPFDAGQLVAYAYLIDNEDAPAASSDTIGLRWTGNTDLVEWPFSYVAEFAHQTDAGDHPVDYDADYLRLEGTVGFEPVSLGLGFESLGGGDAPGAAFSTPLATLHAFNGWADRFLATPDAGLEDLFVTVG